MTVPAGYFDQSYPPSVYAPPEIAATGATAGTPGSFTPAGATPPADAADGMLVLIPDPGTAWTEGQYVATGDGTHWYWDGEAWAEGDAPAPVVPATGATAGAPGTWTPAGSTPPASSSQAGSVVADPTEAWTTGQYVQGTTGGAAGRMYWTGSAWAGGAAP